MTAWESCLAEAWEHGTYVLDDEDDARDAAARRAARDLYERER